MDKSEYSDESFALKVGEFGFFRYVDADSYDPDGFEIYFGMVVDVSWHSDEDGDIYESPFYKILTSSGFFINMGQALTAEDKYPLPPN